MEYRNVNELIPWDKNKHARNITTVNFEKLKTLIKKDGISEELKIGEDNTVYDGNNRLEALKFWNAQGITEAENGASLTNIPVKVYHTPTEAAKWKIALTGNGQFASWNKDGLSNYLPEFEEDLELSLFNVEFDDPESFDEQLVSEETQGGGEKKEKEVQCPNCQHTFKI